MLDIRRIRQNPQELIEALKNRNSTIDLSEFLEKEEQRRALLSEAEALKARRNEESKRIAQIKREGGDAQPIMDEMRALGDEIAAADEKLKDIEEYVNQFMLRLPNYPSPTTPIGKDDTENVEQRRWGTPRDFGWEPKAHWDIGTDLNILDFDAAAKISGARFTVYRGLGARLERAIINFYMDTHAADGYTEILPPYMVTRQTMTGTGQLPKFEEDAYKVDQDTFLIPTAEVPVTNLYRDMILDGKDLPIRHCAYSACFRAEAGSAGRDTRGLIRQHQFNKVEMVKITKPEQMPSYGRYVEISSRSNCEDFQARRAGIRYREDAKSKPQFCHTLNGSGVAVGRTVAAVLENYQNEDGSVTVPEVLRPYMGVDVIR